jgi:hypothetical protein
MHAPDRALVVAVAMIAAATLPRWAPRAGAAPSPIASPSSTTRAWSEQHRFEVGYVSVPSPVPLLAIHAWTVTIADASGRPVDDARLTVLGGMPAHAHGLPTVPEVRNLGGGRYLVEGLKFHMPGAWVVAFRIKAGTVTDSVRFELTL